jgi:hypothetical protein
MKRVCDDGLSCKKRGAMPTFLWILNLLWKVKASLATENRV